jgi:hypothetical protein
MISLDKVSVAVVALWFANAPGRLVESFAVVDVVGRTGFHDRRRSHSTLLVPEQASQLVAAQNCAIANETTKKRKKIESDALSQSIGLLGMARDLAEDMFSLGALGLRRREPATDTGERSRYNEVMLASAFPPAMFERAPSVTKEGRDGDDVVLYPILGFRWIAVDCPRGKKRYQILPTSVRASMPIADMVRRSEEEVVGWFGPVCHLGDPSEEDDGSSYCGSELAIQ